MAHVRHDGCTILPDVKRVRLLVGEGLRQTKGYVVRLQRPLDRHRQLQVLILLRRRPFAHPLDIAHRRVNAQQTRRNRY